MSTHCVIGSHASLKSLSVNLTKVKRLEIRCDIKNEDSKKIAERLGYLLESKLKGNRLNVMTGQISDTLIYVRHNAAALPELSVSWKGLD